MMIALLLVVATGAAFGQQMNTITVKGSAVRYIDPTQAVIRLLVQTKNMEIGKAKKDNELALERVKDVCKSQKIKDEQCKVEYPQVLTGKDYSSPDYSGYGANTYYVNTYMVLEVNDLDRMDKLMTQLFEAGVTNVLSIRFQATNIAQTEQDVMGEALQKAKQTADFLAGKTGNTVGKVMVMEEPDLSETTLLEYMLKNTSAVPEGPVYESYPLDMNYTNYFGIHSYPPMPKKIVVSCRMRVTYELK